MLSRWFIILGRFITIGLACVATVACKNEFLVLGDYESTWVHRALSLQRQLDERVPLARASFIATHNSTNTAAHYQFDPNQLYTLTDQLRMDVRALELDVHSFGSGLVLCHGLSDHTGCNVANRSFRQVLTEISDWITMPGNGSEILLIYIEQHIDNDDFGMALSIIDEVIGDLVYRPSGGGCVGIPMSMSKRDVLDAGRQIVLMSDGCPESGYQSWVFGGVGDSLNGYPTGDVESVSAYPVCDTVEFDRVDFEEKIIRYYEDRTTLSDLANVSGARITKDVLPILSRCEANIIGLDKLAPDDGRLEASVWSWAKGQPVKVTGSENCASHQAEGWFRADDCSTVKAFACRNSTSGEWSITAADGPWEDGTSACGAQGLQFATPFSAYDNASLSDVKMLQGVTSVWLNYTDVSGSGDWHLP